jgi:hypothetical protein
MYIVAGHLLTFRRILPKTTTIRLFQRLEEGAEERAVERTGLGVKAHEIV